MRNAPVVAAPLSQSKQTCPACSTENSVPTGVGFFLCTSCQTPLFAGNLDSSFDVLGAPRTFALDEKALETRYYELSKRLHPDRFAAIGGSALGWTMKLSAAVNQAYLALKTKEDRLETLLRDSNAIGKEASGGAKGQIPVELAEEYFELQEAVAEDPVQAAQVAKIFREKVNEKREALTQAMYGLAEKTKWPATASELAKLVEIRRDRSYLISILENIERLGV